MTTPKKKKESFMCPPSMNKDGKTCNYDKCMAYMGDLYYPTKSNTGCNATGCNCKSVGGRFGSTAKNAHDNTANRSKTEIEQFEAINTNFGSCAGGKQEAESCYLTPNGDDPLKMCTSDGTNHTCSNPWYTEKCIKGTCTADDKCPERSTCIGGKCMVVEQDSALRYQVKPAMTTSMQCRVPLEFTGQACTSSDDCNWDETCEFNKTTKQNQCQKFKYTTPCKTTDDCTTGTCEANVDNNCDFSAGEDYSTMQSNLLDQLRDDMHMMCGLSQKEIVTRNVAMGSWDKPACKTRYMCKNGTTWGQRCDPKKPACGTSETCTKKDEAASRCAWTQKPCTKNDDCASNECNPTVDCTAMRAGSFEDMCMHFGMFNVVPLQGKTNCQCNHCYPPKYCQKGNAFETYDTKLKDGTVKKDKVLCHDNNDCTSGYTCTDIHTKPTLTYDEQEIMDNYCLTKLSCNQGVGDSMTKTVQSGDGYCANPNYVIGHNEMYKQDRNRCYQARGEWNTTTSTCDFDNAEYPERYCNLYGGFWVARKIKKDVTEQVTTCEDKDEDYNDCTYNKTIEIKKEANGYHCYCDGKDITSEKRRELNNLGQYIPGAYTTRSKKKCSKYCNAKETCTTKTRKRKVCTTKNVTKQKTVDDSVKYCRLIDTEASCNDVGGIYVKQRFCQNKNSQEYSMDKQCEKDSDCGQEEVCGQDAKEQCNYTPCGMVNPTVSSDTTSCPTGTTCTFNVANDVYGARYWNHAARTCSTIIPKDPNKALKWKSSRMTANNVISELQEYLQYSDPLQCTDKDMDYMIFNSMHSQVQNGWALVPNTKKDRLYIQRYGKPEPFTVKECKTVRKFWKYTCNQCNRFGCSWHPWTCNGDTPDDDCCMKKTSNYQNVEECTSIKGTAWKPIDSKAKYYMFKPDYKNENDKFWTDRMYYVPSTGKVDKGWITETAGSLPETAGSLLYYTNFICGRNTDPFKQDKDPPLLDTTKKTERRMSNPYDPRSRKVLDLKTPIPRGTSYLVTKPVNSEGKLDPKACQNLDIRQWKTPESVLFWDPWNKLDEKQDAYHAQCRWAIRRQLANPVQRGTFSPNIGSVSAMFDELFDEEEDNATVQGSSVITSRKLRSSKSSSGSQTTKTGPVQSHKTSSFGSFGW